MQINDKKKAPGSSSFSNISSYIFGLFNFFFFFCFTSPCCWACVNKYFNNSIKTNEPKEANRMNSLHRLRRKGRG